MARFVFRLQTLLSARVRERNERRVELAEAVEIERALHAQAQRVSGELAIARDGISSRQDPFDLVRCQVHDRFDRLLRHDLGQLNDRLDAATTETQRRRELLTAAEQQVRALEKLRERQAAEFQRQQNAVDQRELDEAASRTTQPTALSGFAGSQ
jgi:flagellar export protein FliJ